MLYNLCNRCQTKIEYPSRICDTCKAEKEEEQKQRLKDNSSKYNKARHEREKEMNSYRLFYNTREWRLKREEIHRRDGICKICEALFMFNPIDDIHHIIPISKDYSKRLDNDNLVGLCSKHHKMIHDNSIDTKDKLNKYVRQLQNSDKFLKELLKDK